jgi:hypothetical protein
MKIPNTWHPKNGYRSMKIIGHDPMNPKILLQSITNQTSVGYKPVDNQLTSIQSSSQLPLDLLSTDLSTFDLTIALTYSSSQTFTQSINLD